MPTALESVLSQLATTEATISGIKRAYTTIPEGMAEFPCFVNMPRRGSSVRMSGVVEDQYTIKVELHVARAVLPEADALARSYITAFEDKIWTDPTLNATVTTVNDVRHEYVVFPVGRELHLGVIFEVDVKLRRLMS